MSGLRWRGFEGSEAEAERGEVEGEVEAGGGEEEVRLAVEVAVVGRSRCAMAGRCCILMSGAAW